MLRAINSRNTVISSIAVGILSSGLLANPVQASILPPPTTVNKIQESNFTLPNPSPAPSPTPPKESSNVSASISSTISAIKDSAIYSAVTNSPSYQAAKSVQEGLANTGLIAAAAQSAKVLYNMAKVAVILWLVSQ